MQRRLISLVVPMFNESMSCHRFFDRVLPQLRGIGEDFEIVCVNDGSTDGTLQRLNEARARDPRIKIVNLSRNFGKEAALTAGLDHAAGQAVIPIDADLQDPPELIATLVAKWREGHKCVVAIRASRRGDSYFKRATARAFYRVLAGISEIPIPANAGDFRLLDRSVVDALRRLPERTRFMKGLFAWVGFEQSHVEYDRPGRAAGASKWRFWKLWNFALEGVFSFSSMPLKIWSYVGFVIAALSGLYGIFIVVMKLAYGIDVAGYASLIVAVLFVGGVNMIGIGMLGEYVSRIFIEVKQRPLYVVASRHGFEETDGSGDAAARGA